MILLDLLSAIVVIIPTVLFLNTTITIDVVYLIVIILGFILALDAPTRAGIIRMILKDEELSEAYTINSFLTQFNMYQHQ